MLCGATSLLPGCGICNAMPSRCHASATLKWENISREKKYPNAAMALSIEVSRTRGV